MLPPSGAFTFFSSEAWGPGRGQEGTFVGPRVGLLKSHPSKSICRPELLTTETCLSCFFFFFNCCAVSSISPKSACICHLCGYLRTRGLLYSFLGVTLTTTAAGVGGGGVGGGGREPVTLQALWSWVQSEHVVKLTRQRW